MRLRLAAALLLLAAACGDGGTRDLREVRVFAAASLSDALAEIATAYARTSTDRVLFNFGGSGTLARQIERGAPADLFVSADGLQMDRLQAGKFVAARTRVTLVSNRLAIVVARDSAVNLSRPEQLESVARIAVGDPDTVASGRYARAWLQSKRLWGRLQPKVIPTGNVRATVAAVASGNADAGIVFVTDARSSAQLRIALEVPEGEGPPISYPAAVVESSTAKEAAALFLDFLKSKEASTIFAKYGFVVSGR